ncbi:MAG: sugar phosphate isomerase/epimerase [Pirellulales bacterium]|nr:sugar phosphate isomerase/epimerase [Pirellulales bacterium]
MHKPDSKFNGVQIGVLTYNYRSMSISPRVLLGYVTQCGVNSVEMMGESVEQFAGAPGGKSLLDWRLSAPMDKFKELRKMYDDAGVKIHIVKFIDIGDPGMSDAQIEYYFKVAKAIGADGITRELSAAAAKRLGPIADKHKIMIGFHNHTQIRPDTYDGDVLSSGKYLRINLDIGHYVAATNESPIPFIEKHKDRILSLHLRDRKINNGPTVPFGMGDTPIAIVLQYLKKNKLSFHADIETGYESPAGSDAVKEVAKSVQFCKKALAQKPNPTVSI